MCLYYLQINIEKGARRSLVLQVTCGLIGKNEISPNCIFQFSVHTYVHTYGYTYMCLAQSSFLNMLAKKDLSSLCDTKEQGRPNYQYYPWMATLFPEGRGDGPSNTRMPVFWYWFHTDRYLDLLLKSRCSISLNAQISEDMIWPICYISWWRWTDDGKTLGWIIISFQKNRNENQEILKRTGMLVSGFSIEEEVGMGWKQQICVSCFHGSLIKRGVSRYQPK